MKAKKIATTVMKPRQMQFQNMKNLKKSLVKFINLINLKNVKLETFFFEFS